MRTFEGLKIKPYSKLSDIPETRIDRTRIEVHKTLFGDVVFEVVGTLGRDGEGVPVSGQFHDFYSAWARKVEIEAAVEAARKTAR